MYEFWYDYMKPKYAANVKLCYMDDSFIFYVKTKDVYKDIADGVEKRFACQIMNAIPLSAIDHYLQEK